MHPDAKGVHSSISPSFIAGATIGAVVASLVAVGVILGLWRVGVMGAHDHRVFPLSARLEALEEKSRGMTSRLEEALAIRPVDGSEIGEGGNLSRQPPAGEGWQVVGIGDFNSDGRTDILWRNPSGTTNIFLMNGTNAVDYENTTAQLGNEWRVRGIGDFNGDGKADILWRRADGATSIWLMDGIKVLNHAK